MACHKMTLPNPLTSAVLLKNQQLRLPRRGAAFLTSLSHGAVLLQFNFTRVLNNATQGMMHEVRVGCP